MSAYELGIKAYKSGETLEDNPYDADEDLEDHYSWHEGFLDSVPEESPVFVQYENVEGENK